ncbi:MAG TPA: ParB/Srx family N-terminal domain-containing protein [Terriglobales bacterium]|nr:ParB/Srx family N-terminal domain-containing protein [Terriglobales bacterium]
MSLVFREVDFDLLETASTLKHWDVLAMWTRQISCRRVIPPLIVTPTPHGTYYIHDGNHRYEALRVCFKRNLKRLRLRVAVVQPKVGYEFELRQFPNYQTYVLVPAREGEPALSEEEFSDAPGMGSLLTRLNPAEAVAAG